MIGWLFILRFLLFWPMVDQLLAALPFVEGFPNLLRWLADNDFEVIVISDANTYFINHILETHGLDNCVTKVFSNPAYFDENGLLRIEWYHSQDYCDLSNKNMCKGWWGLWMLSLLL